MESEAEKRDLPPAERVAPESGRASDEVKPERVFSENAIHMIRTAQINTLTLSQMADQKASILMGATFLVFSLSISRSLTGDMPGSLVLLALFSFLSSVCAVFAVVPSIGKPGVAKTGGGGAHTGPNRLFFGHFTAIEESEWADSLLRDMTRDEAVLRTMMHDLYQNGCVLQRRKYRYLALAYRIFIVGLFVTLLVFAVEIIRS